MNKCAGAGMPSVAGTSKIILGHFSRFGLPVTNSPDCPWSCCLPACPVDVYFLRYLGGQVVQAHDPPDVRDVEARAGLCSYVLLHPHRGNAAACHVCNDGVHGISGNSSGPSASGKIPEAFKASFVVTAQPVAGPRGTVYQDAGSLIHGHVKHTHHANGDHPSPNLVNLFARLFEIFPFNVVHVIIKIRSDLQTFRLFTHELWRVTIVCNGIRNLFNHEIFLAVSRLLEYGNDLI